MCCHWNTLVAMVTRYWFLKRQVHRYTAFYWTLCFCVGHLSGEEGGSSRERRSRALPETATGAGKYSPLSLCSLWISSNVARCHGLSYQQVVRLWKNVQPVDGWRVQLLLTISQFMLVLVNRAHWVQRTWSITDNIYILGSCISASRFYLFINFCMLSCVVCVTAYQRVL